MSPTSTLATLLAAFSILAVAAPGCSGGSAVKDEAEAPAASAEPDAPAADTAKTPADASASPANSATPASSAVLAASATPATSAAASGVKKDVGASCDVAGDCASGVCEGEGCGAGGGKCAAADRRCTRDLRQYCGCDGKTFSGSGSCPNGRYAKKGSCEGESKSGPKLPSPPKKP